MKPKTKAEILSGWRDYLRHTTHHEASSLPDEQFLAYLRKVLPGGPRNGMWEVFLYRKPSRLDRLLGRNLKGYGCVTHYDPEVLDVFELTP